MKYYFTVTARIENELLIELKVLIDLQNLFLLAIDLDTK